MNKLNELIELVGEKGWILSVSKTVQTPLGYIWGISIFKTLPGWVPVNSQKYTGCDADLEFLAGEMLEQITNKNGN